MSKENVLFFKRIIFIAWIFFLLFIDVNDIGIFGFIMRLLLCFSLIFASKNYLFNKDK